MGSLSLEVCKKQSGKWFLGDFLPGRVKGLIVFVCERDLTRLLCGLNTVLRLHSAPLVSAEAGGPSGSMAPTLVLNGHPSLAGFSWGSSGSHP